MHALLRSSSLVCAALAGLASPLTVVAHAQGNMGTMDGPPKVLIIQREFLKPGKGGMTHDRSESAFVKAMADAKYPTHYFAMDSLSGASRSLFIVGYDSFAAWEKDNAMMRENKTLSAAFDRAALNDGELLTSYDSGAFQLRPDLSLNKGSIHNTRYFEMTLFMVKPGHVMEFEELAKIYIEGFRKAAPDTHWDTFEQMYGTPAPGMPSGGIFLVVNTMKSLSETDRGSDDFKKFVDVIGKDGMKKIEQLTAASVYATTTNLFEINPRMSYPPQEWVDAEPGFWKVEHPMAAAKKPAPKAATP